jgi:hypothetical protein
MKNRTHQRKTKIVICEYCKNEFEKTISEIKRSEEKGYKHYCSRQCGGKSRENNNIKYCKQCGKEIKLKIFCSQSCAATYNNKNRKGEKRNFSKIGIQNILNAINKKTAQNINRDEYDKNPNHCKECNNALIFKFRNRTFCSVECRRKYERKNMGKYQIYHKNCRFTFNLFDYLNEFDFELIKKYGWYQAKNHGDNLNGISRDHMISVKFGYENNINPEIIKHPANCQLLIHNNNSSKNKKCSLTLNELINKIDKWNLKYN